MLVRLRKIVFEEQRKLLHHARRNLPNALTAHLKAIPDVLQCLPLNPEAENLCRALILFSNFTVGLLEVIAIQENHPSVFDQNAALDRSLKQHSRVKRQL